MFQRIVLFLIAFLPLVVINSSYEKPKVFLFLVLGFLASISLISNFLKKEITKLSFKKKDIFLLLWILVLGISAFLNNTFSNSIIGSGYRLQGVVFFLGLFILGKFVSQLTDKNKKLLSILITYVVLIESIIVILQFLFNKLYFGRPLGTVGEANALGGFLTLGSYFLIISLKTKWYWVSVLAILITQSRAAILSAIVWIFSFGKKIKPLFKLVLIGIFTLSFLGIFYFSNRTSIYEDRLVLWRFGVKAVYDKPILGYGPESGTWIFNNTFLKEKEIILGDFMIDRSHNLLIDVLMWSGIIGATLFGLWIFYEFKDLDKLKKSALFVFLIFSFFQPLSVVHWVLLLTILNV